MSFLRVENLTRRFGGIVALHDVSFSMEKGEILGLMGANGAGKTTLFSLIAGNLPPSSGHILLEDEKIDGRGPHRVNRLGVARTFQIVRPFATMSVLDNVMVGALYGRSRTLSQPKAREKCRAILDEVGLADRADLPAAALTLAGRKRLEVARALATEPRLLLLDEVLAGLNASEANDALDLIRHLRDSRMLSIIVIEHVMKALMRLSHRILVLHDGRKIMEGAPAEVANDPRVIKAYLGETRDA
ncbi:ABC transporter ATP-binding protein [Beijerinckia sp. L45]|uniref:ABC transporter ATP-binding protein n=1 Tax=Beijerinckia sp. L45 TaxID=1641855 RepID=UPI00131ABBB2|nr:ABC transporter ATP-binding protein [Beijerinckia sp. L45]